MAWKCPQCGVEGLDDSVGHHSVEAGGCGYVKFPSGVELVSDATGKSIRMRLPTTFGQASLKILADPEVRFASSEQFRVDKSPEAGGWVVTGIAWATNPTFLNGAALPPEGAVLRDGDKVTVSGRHFSLTVHLIA